MRFFGTIGMVVSVLALGVHLASCASEGNACLQETPTNAQAKLDGQLVEMRGEAKMETGVSPTPTGLIWTNQLTIHLDINLLECDHRITFWVDNPAEGTPVMTGTASDDGPTYTGMYGGELGAESLTSDSKLTITAFDTKVSGTFTAVLPDGTTFTGGTFDNVIVD